jgi:membrane-bound serine protease (ClpP class)
MSIVFLAFFVAGAGMFMFSKYTHKFPLAGKLVLAHEQRAWGAKNESMLEAMGEQAADPEAAVRVDDTGAATTNLRPSGTARIGGRLIDVVSELGFIEEGEAVRVVSVTKYRVAVEQINADGDTA